MCRSPVFGRHSPSVRHASNSQTAFWPRTIGDHDPPPNERCASGERQMKSYHSSGLIILGLAAVVSVPNVATLSAQALNQETLVGCYELKVGPWNPPLGTAAQFSTPPDTVQLFADSSYDHPQPGWKRASPAIRHSYSRGRDRAIWTVLDQRSFRIIWSDGLTGADLRLFRGSDAFFGIIRMLSDVIGPEATTPKATVVAKRVECKVSGRAEPHNTR